MKETPRGGEVQCGGWNPGIDMAARQSLSATLQHLNRLTLAGDLAELPDAELVGRFVAWRDEAAFTALVRRHGTLVLGVCRRVLRHEQDAEDAFQATFLVLARDAARVQRPAAVGNWLYGVAYNVARKAKAVQQRRAVKERDAASLHRQDRSGAAVDELREVLDCELFALPDKYRVPIVLCDLMGLTTREAAEKAGCPHKTLGTRLSRGRSLLARRLTRRGVAVPVAVLTTTPTIPTSLLASTIHAAIRFADGSSAVVTPAVAALTVGVSNVMQISFKTVAAIVCGTLALGALLHAPLGAAHGTRNTPVTANVASGPPRTTYQSFLAYHLKQGHHVFTHLLAQVGLGWSGGELTSDPAGTWTRKEGELKLEFADKTVLKISPHGKDELILFLCEYTVDKDGVVKAKITGFEGKQESKDKAKERLPVGTEFSFKWTVKNDSATLEDLKGEKLEAFKSLLEGEFAKK